MYTNKNHTKHLALLVKMFYHVDVTRILTVSLPIPFLSALYDIYRMAKMDTDIWLRGCMFLITAFFSLFSITPRNERFNITRKCIYEYVFRNNKILEEILSDNQMRKRYQEITWSSLERKI